MKFKTIDDLDVEGKTVLLRADLNSPVIEEEVQMSPRIRAASRTIKELKDKDARVIILAHQGRPGSEDYTSLEQHDRLLNKLVKTKFVDGIITERAIMKIKNSKMGEAILLENTRSMDDEFKPGKTKNKMVEKLLPIADIYINDAFSVSHRDQTSIVSFAQKLPSGIGRTMEKELEMAEKIDLNECLYILGGAKPKDNLKLMDGNEILACGLFGQCCAIAKGIDLGKQNKFLSQKIDGYNDIINEIKKNLDKVEIPEDFAIDKEGERKEIPISNFPSKYEIFDIGRETQKKFKNKIRNANAIYMKGPAGYCEDEKFSEGTLKILKVIGESDAFSLIGGGNLSEAMEKYNVSKDNFNHVSLSGGALLNYIAGEKLPGLEALKVNGLK